VVHAPGSPLPAVGLRKLADFQIPTGTTAREREALPIPFRSHRLEPERTGQKGARQCKIALQQTN